ncbi:hypothetical protein ccbrp13_20050 [Ktedonobacteria bacterium brp13]|nr:hypothetical protein ccbrp13_20050 [Ktedonobacteria bacterium brp13]
MMTFTSSGQFDPALTSGYNDVVTLSLQHVTPPPAGMVYGVWLMPDKADDETMPLILGHLSVMSHGQAYLQYTAAAHTNLLATYSGVRIIMQQQNSNPMTPPQDPQTWCWEGWFPNIPTPGDAKGYSWLSHLRHLLAQDPTLQQNHIPGGLVTWMTRNLSKIEEWSSAAQGSWGEHMSDGTADLIHRQLIRIIDYLDGASYAWQDVPNSPWLVDPVAGKIGLLNVIPNQEPPGYLAHVDLHLNGLTNAPGHTQAQQMLALQIDPVMTRVTTDLLRVRKDAILLVHDTDTQLRQPKTLSILNEMVALTMECNSGWFDPGTGEDSGGVIWLAARMQQFATVDLSASHHPV